MPGVPIPRGPAGARGWVFLCQPQEAMATRSLLSELITASAGKGQAAAEGPGGPGEETGECMGLLTRPATSELCDLGRVTSPP